MTRPTHRLRKRRLFRSPLQANKRQEVADIIVMQTGNKLKLIKRLHRMVIHIKENLLLLLRREPKELTNLLGRGGIKVDRMLLKFLQLLLNLLQVRFRTALDNRLHDILYRARRLLHGASQHAAEAE